MNRLGTLKVIIETDEKSEIYGLLLFNEDTRQGSLLYFNKEEKITDFEHEGIREWALKVIQKAQAICKEYNGYLTKY